MSLFPLLANEPSGLKTFCCKKTDTDWPRLLNSKSEMIEKIDQILSGRVLCHHDIEALSLAYRKIEQIELDIPLQHENQLPSTMIIKKVQNQIDDLFSKKNPEPSDLVKIYHLSHFPPIAPPHKQGGGNSIVDCITKRIKSAIGEAGKRAVAERLPYCVSKENFSRDLEALGVLTGPELQNSFYKDLSLEEENSPTKSLLTHPRRLLELDAKLRERRSAFLERPDANTYPSYFDQILEEGFLDLYDYLLGIAEAGGQAEHREKVGKLEASSFSRVVIDVRDAIIHQVWRLVGENEQNLVFLVGNTGSGKSTVFSLLMGANLERKGDAYEVPGQEIISHSLASSCTFLPNVGSAQNCTYVDFPGFNDTRGEPIELGVELAFKFLVHQYKPKIVIVESINAMQSSRGEPVRALGKQLARMLGAEAKEELCSLFLTQYLRLVELARLEQELKEEKRLSEEVQNLCLTIEQKRAIVKQIQIKIDHVGQGNAEKMQTYAAKISKIEEDLQELERGKEQGLSEKLYGRLRSSYREKLESKQNALRRLEGGDTDQPEKKRLTKEKESEERRIEAACAKKRKKEEQVRLARENIERERELLEEKTRVILELLGVKNAPHKITELRYLEKPESLTGCKEVLSHAQPVVAAYTRLSDSNRAGLLKLFKDTLENGGLPPFPEIDIENLKQNALKTSLINVMTVGHSPEIGGFLHLAEMDSGCAEEIDRFVVTEFTETLIRLIVMGSLQGNPKENVVKLYIDGTLQQLEKTHSAARDLRKRWDALEERVENISGTGAKSWKDLEQHYQSRFRAAMAKLQQDKQKPLKSLEAWAAKVFGTPFLLARYAFVNLSSQEEEKIIEEVGRRITQLETMFDNLKDLQKIIRSREKSEARELVSDPKHPDTNDTGPLPFWYELRTLWGGFPTLPGRVLEKSWQQNG